MRILLFNEGLFAHVDAADVSLVRWYGIGGLFEWAARGMPLFGAKGARSTCTLIG